jgi:hypothetical protein
MIDCCIFAHEVRLAGMGLGMRHGGEHQGECDHRAGEAREETCEWCAARVENFIHAPKRSTRSWCRRALRRAAFSH